MMRRPIPPGGSHPRGAAVRGPACSGHIKIHELGRMASVLARIDARRQLIAAEDGFYIRTIADGAMTLHCPLEADNPGHPLQRWPSASVGHILDRHNGAQGRVPRGRDLRASPWRGPLEPVTCSPASPFRMRSASRRTARPAISPTRARIPCTAYRLTRTQACRWAPEILLHHKGIGGLERLIVDADGLIWNARWGDWPRRRSQSGELVASHSSSGARLQPLRPFWSAHPRPGRR